MRFLSRSAKKNIEVNTGNASIPSVVMVFDDQTIQSTASTCLMTNTKYKPIFSNKVLKDSQVGRRKPKLIGISKIGRRKQKLIDISKKKPIGPSSVSDTSTKSKSINGNKALTDSQGGRGKPKLINGSEKKSIGISLTLDTSNKSKSINGNKALTDSQVERRKPKQIDVSEKKLIGISSTSDTSTKSKSINGNKALTDSQVGRRKQIDVSEKKPNSLLSISDTSTKTKSINGNKALMDLQVEKSKLKLIDATENKLIDPSSASDTSTKTKSINGNKALMDSQVESSKPKRNDVSEKKSIGASSTSDTSTKSQSINDNKALTDSQVGRRKPKLIDISENKPISLSSISDTSTKTESINGNTALKDSQVGRRKPKLLYVSKKKPGCPPSVSETSTKSKSTNTNKALTDSQVGRHKPKLINVSEKKPIGISSISDTSTRTKSINSNEALTGSQVDRNMSVGLKRSDTFEDWLQLDPQESFKIKIYEESGNKKLSLEGELKSPEEGDIIPHLIKNDEDLTWLSLGDCKIGHDKYLAVIEALKSNTALKFISLSFTGIDIDGCLAIKETLTVNQTLTSIDLKNNNVGDLGFVAIMDAMQNNHTITNLDLRWNRISGNAMHAMRDALYTNTKLQKVDLRGNSIGNEGCLMIMDGLHKNTTLLNLHMERNHIHVDLLQECMAFVKRNEIIHHHCTNVDFLGICYYVTIEGMAYRKPYLTWAVNNSTTIIDEAAKSIESFALVVFIDTLCSILDPENSDAQSKLSDSFYSPTILRMILDREQLNGLVNQKINDDTYLHHMLAASKHPRSLDMLKFLIDRCNACFYTLEDTNGLTARAIALASEDDAKHEWANTHEMFLGRYIIEGGKGIKSNPFHKSATSMVHFAHDVTKGENDPKYQVTIKIMRNEETYKRERQIRLNEGESLLTLSSGEDIPISYNRYDTDSIVTLYRFHDEVDVTGQHYQCLIFEKHGKNLNQIIDSELITGNNEATVSRYGRGLAKAIQHVHAKGNIHADIKPRKIIRASNNLLKLIDLDNSIATGKTVTNDCSSAFTSPEITRALLESKEDKVRSIQKRIIEQHKRITKLDLSKKNDMDAYDEANEKIQALLASKVVHQNDEGNLKASPSLDIWGFGVIMYYLCIGQPLFLYNLNDNLATESEKNRLLTWQGLTRTNLDKVCPACLSEPFREKTYTFLMKCLHMDPAERFQSMEEILDHNLFCEAQTQQQFENGNQKLSTINPRGCTNTALLPIDLNQLV